MDINEREDIIHDKAEDISLKQLILKLRDWFYYLFSKWLVIVALGLIGSALGFWYASYKRPIYTAVTTFVLEEGNSNSNSLGNLGGLASMVGIDVGGGGGIFQGDNILELYKSRTMIQKTLLTPVVYIGKQKLLIDIYIDDNNLRKRWNSNPQLKAVNFSPSSDAKISRLQDSVLGAACEHINFSYLKVSKPDKKLNIIKAEVKSYSEFFAKTFNDQIVKNVNDFYSQTKTKKSMENIAILREKVDSVRFVMNGAIYSAAQVSDKTPNLNPTKLIQRIAPIQRAEFNAETNKAILSELIKNLEMSKLNLLKETPLIQVVDTPILPLQKESFGRAKGIVLGGLIFGFLTTFFLILKRLFKIILS